MKIQVLPACQKMINGPSTIKKYRIKKSRILQTSTKTTAGTGWNKGGFKMSIFSKKEKIVLFSEQQKDQMIEKLEKAHIEYDVRENKESVFSNKVSYILRVNQADLKKVV